MNISVNAKNDADKTVTTKTVTNSCHNSFGFNQETFENSNFTFDK